MEKIRFINSDTIYNVEFSKINTSVLQLIFYNAINETVISSGFNILNEHNLQPQGDYTMYTTIYRKVSDTVYQLSKDESAYVPDPTPDPLPEPTLENIKQRKISEITTANMNSIKSGTSVTINDVSTNFMFAESDQKELKQLFYNALVSGLSMYYKNVLYTSNDVINIYKTLYIYKKSKEVYIQQLINYINSLTVIDDVNNIVYGQELTGDYLTAYNTSYTSIENEITTYINEYIKKRTYNDNLYSTDVNTRVIYAYDAIAILYETRSV